MSSSPKKQQATAQEKSLYHVSQEQLNEATGIQKAVQKGYINRAQKDQSGKLKSRVNADAMQAMAGTTGENPFQSAQRLTANIDVRNKHMTKANSDAKQMQQNNILNAVNVGKGQQAQTTQSLGSLANLKHNEMQQQMQRSSMIDSAQASAWGNLAMGGVAAYQHHFPGQPATNSGINNKTDEVKPYNYPAGGI